MGLLDEAYRNSAHEIKAGRVIPVVSTRSDTSRENTGELSGVHQEQQVQYTRNDTQPNSPSKTTRRGVRRGVVDSRKIVIK